MYTSRLAETSVHLWEVKTLQKVGVRIPTVHPLGIPKGKHGDRLAAIVRHKPYFHHTQLLPIGDTRFKITFYLLHMIYFITINATDNSYKYMTTNANVTTILYISFHDTNHYTCCTMYVTKNSFTLGQKLHFFFFLCSSG